MADPTVPIAFIAGAASFLSPCVLPLVPGYLSYMSGLEAGESAPSPRKVLPVTIGFVLGFTLVFVALGASVTLLGDFLAEHRRLLARVSGVFIILLGLVFIGVVKVPFLYRERRFHPRPEAGLAGSVLLGAAFAFGWSPCIGPTMGAVLLMASGQGASGGPGRGAFLLGVYSLGLGLPFVLAGLGVARLSGAVAWLRKHSRAVATVSGTLLVVVGILFATEQLFRLSAWMNRAANDLGVSFWNEL